MPNYIYVIAVSEAGPCKIGHSADPERRLKQLQTGHAGRLTLFHREAIEVPVKKMERAIHETIGYKRVLGEWFNVSVAEAVSEIQHAVIFHEEKLAR